MIAESIPPLTNTEGCLCRPIGPMCVLSTCTQTYAGLYSSLPSELFVAPGEQEDKTLLNAERTARWGGRAVLTWRLGSGYCSTAHGHAQTCVHTLCVLGMTVKHAVTWRWEGEAPDRKDKRKKIGRIRSRETAEARREEG